MAVEAYWDEVDTIYSEFQYIRDTLNSLARQNDELLKQNAVLKRIVEALDARIDAHDKALDCLLSGDSAELEDTY